MSSLTGQILRSPRFRAMRAASSVGVRRAEAVLARRAPWFAAVALVFALQAALVVTHRPWLDEIQALQLAVEAPNLTVLLEWLRYEGHPPLFYLLLRGLAHLMEPLASLPVLAAALAAIAQACILFRSPFTRAERLLIALSTFVLFDFLTLSRSMTLGVTVVIAAAKFWRSRWSWLAIALLPMCDFLFGVISAIMVLRKARERALFWPGIVLWVASGLLATWSIRPADDMLPALETTGFARDFVGYIAGLGTLALPFQGGLLPGWNRPPFPLAGILWLPFLILCWTSTRDAFDRLMLFGFIGLTFLFSVVVYPLAIRHLMLIALLLIVLTWLRRTNGERPWPGFRLWLAVCALCGVATAALALVKPFDTAPEAAAAIARRGLDDKHWMAWPDSRAQVVSAISGIDFERTVRHCMQSAIRWNYRTTLRSPRRLERYLTSEIERHGRFYLLSDLKVVGLPRDIIAPIETIPAGYDGQKYRLYVVGRDAAERPVSLPPCIAGRRPFARLGETPGLGKK